MVIDYDEETLDLEETWWIKQGKTPDAKIVGAYVSFLTPDRPKIDVEHLKEGGGALDTSEE